MDIVLRYQSDYFGKHGFRRAWTPQPETMNVGELDEKLDTLLTDGHATKTTTGITINLDELGVDKLLGVGKVTHSMMVTVASCSKPAASKISELSRQVFALEDS
jgi:large subunit ribosomal protein L15